MFVFAHLSDPHLGPVPVPYPQQLLNKRLTSYLAWLLRNRHYHNPDQLMALLADMRRFVPEHILVTGDLTNIGLPQEFKRARAFLAAIGDPGRVTVIPGNHDTCVAAKWRDSFAYWSDFMSGSTSAHENEVEGDAPEHFPFVRRRGPAAFIALNSAVPRPVTKTPAAGVLGPQQIARFGRMLELLRAEGLFRVVLIHHAPYLGLSPRKALLDAPEFARTVADKGAELILHGHLHQSDFEETRGPNGVVPVVGVTSASGVTRRGKPPARFHVFGLSGMPGSWNLEVHVREAMAMGREFRTERKFTLDLAQGGLRPGQSFKAAALAAIGGKPSRAEAARPLSGTDMRR